MALSRHSNSLWSVRSSIFWLIGLLLCAQFVVLSARDDAPDKELSESLTNKQLEALLADVTTSDNFERLASLSKLERNESLDDFADYPLILFRKYREELVTDNGLTMRNLQAMRGIVKLAEVTGTIAPLTNELETL